MTSLQSYFFREILVPLLLTTAIMALLALLTQSLSSIDLIIDNRASLLAFLKITSLSLPQLVSIILPFAVFVSVAYTVQRMHTDNEIVVFYAGSMSQWQVISPVLRVALLAMVVNLALNLFVQPMTFRAMREAIYQVRSDIASAIVRPGEFVSPALNLTIFAREMHKGVMQDVFIHDGRNRAKPVTYLAASGVFTNVANHPSITLHDASRQVLSENGSLTFLTFSSTRFELNGVIEPQGEMVYKYSDRYLSELFHPNMADYWEQQNWKALLAEGHYRLSSPLYDVALALLALSALLAGDFNKLGYGRRLMAYGAAALLVRLLGFSFQAAAEDNIWMNVAQYFWPILVSLLCLVLLFRKKPVPKQLQPTGAN